MFPVFLFICSFTALLVMLVYILIYIYPQSELFWKRSDYLYFGFVVMGSTSGFFDLVVRDYEK